MGRISFGNNIASLAASRRLSESSISLSRTFERLSSGLRINRASDDAAGLAIATSLTKDSRVYTQAIRNTNDAFSVLGIVDETLNQFSDIVIRLKELAAQSANGTFSLSQRLSLDDESEGLINEFNRLVASTKFNSLNIMDSTLSTLGIQIGYGNNGALSLSLSSQLARRLGTGFNSKINTTTNSSTGINGIGSGDFNGDGRVDFVFTDASDGVVNLHLGNGDGTFSSGTVITGAQANSSKIIVGDFNGDGNLDVVTQSAVGGTPVRVSFGNGQGGFTTGSSNNTSLSFSGGLVAGDVNNDGKLDLVGLNGTNGRVLLGDGTGNFTISSFTSSVSSTDAQLGDLNGDGNLDLIIGGAASLVTYLGSGSGSFSLAGTKSLSSATSKVAVSDFNFDGLADVAVSSSAGASINVFLSQGGGTLGTATSYTGLTGANGLQVTDVTGDGVADLTILGTNLATVLKGLGDGTFESAYTKTTTSGTPNLTVADFNGDGVNDLLTVASSLTSIDLYLSSTTTTNTLQRINLTTRLGALDAFSTLDEALNRILKEKGVIGGHQRRLLSVLNTLEATSSNYEGAAGRITNSDVAQESAELLRLQILQQIGSAILGQANQLPNLALSLLRT